MPPLRSSALGGRVADGRDMNYVQCDKLYRAKRNGRNCVCSY